MASRSISFLSLNRSNESAGLDNIFHLFGIRNHFVVIVSVVLRSQNELIAKKVSCGDRNEACS